MYGSQRPSREEKKKAKFASHCMVIGVRRSKRKAHSTRFFIIYFFDTVLVYLLSPKKRYLCIRLIAQKQRIL